MRVSSGLLWCLLVAATALVAVVLLATTAPSAKASCTAADRSRDAHLIGEAERAYAEILKAEPDSTCARRGMRTVVEEKCSRADTLAAKGVEAEARKLYTAIIAADLPGWNDGATPDDEIACAIDGLADLGDGSTPEKGDKGEKGDRGETGDKGEAGPPGKVVIVTKCKWKPCRGR